MPGDLFSLKNQIILITGSSRGLGWAMAQAGATVILIGRDQKLLQQRLEELKDANLEAGLQVFDVSYSKAVIEGIQSIADRHRVLDGLVNNAGINLRKPIHEFELSDYDRLMDTNLRSCFLLSREASKLMLQKQSGSIHKLSSIMGPQARKTVSAYTTSKGGIIGLTKALAVELGPQGIRCNAIAPGFFATEMNTALVDNPEFSAFIVSRNPLQGWGQPNEIGGAAVFLMSAAAKNVNGHVLTIDGGISCQV